MCGVRVWECVYLRTFLLRYLLDKETACSLTQRTARGRASLAGRSRCGSGRQGAPPPRLVSAHASPLGSTHLREPSNQSSVQTRRKMPCSSKFQTHRVVVWKISHLPTRAIQLSSESLVTRETASAELHQAEAALLY